jgi:hypothetical protein
MQRARTRSAPCGAQSDEPQPKPREQAEQHEDVVEKALALVRRMTAKEVRLFDEHYRNLSDCKFQNAA